MIKHPIYGTIEQLMEAIRHNTESGYLLTIEMQGALNWFAYQYSILSRKKA